MTPAREKALMEKLAALEHDRWSRWMIHVFKVSFKNADGSYLIPKDFVERWERQIETPYAELSEPEKEADRREVRKGLGTLLIFTTEKEGK